MSESFNRRFALEQAAKVATRQSNPINDGTGPAIVGLAARFLTFLEDAR